MTVSISRKSKLEDEKIDEKAPQNDETKLIQYHQLFRFATKLDLFYLLVASLCSIICGGAQPYMMILFGEVTGSFIKYVSAISNDTISDLEQNRATEIVYEDVKIFAITTCLIGVFTILTTYISGVLYSFSSISQTYKMRRLFLERTLNQDIGWYDINQTGDFASTFTDNLAKIEEGIGEKIGLFLFFESSFVVGIILALIKGWELALICMISLPLSSISMGLISWLSTKFSQQEMESYAAAGSIAEEVLSSIRTVVAFDGQEKELDRYNKHLVNAEKNNIKRSLFNALSNGIMWFFIYASCALSFWYGVGLIIKEKNLTEDEKVYDSGNMIAVFFATLSATWCFGVGAPFLEIFGVAKGAASKVFTVLDNAPTIDKQNSSGLKPSKFEANIIFKDVQFNYPSRPDVKILQGFNLKISHGETLALVGSSGCGKSTCIQLIQRYYDPHSGSIEVDGNNIRNLNLKWLREKIGVVGQEPALFGTTISENIRYGKLSASQNDIEEAAKKANAHYFITNLPHGYETVIGERGAQLSGGQKQRIAIARALIRKPEILLLDEATSALDTTSEAEVQAALDAVSGECTTIIVAHRLSTIRNANRIVVLSEGRVIEEGSHAELIEKQGAYYNLVISQGLSEESNDITEGKTILKRALSLSNKSNTESEEEQETGEIIEEQKISNNILWKIMKMNQPEWFSITLGCLGSVVSGASLPLYAIVFGNIVGVLAIDDNDELRNESNFYSLCFLLIGVASGIAMFMQMYSFCYAGEKLTLRMRFKTFEAMLRQEMGWYDKKENGVGALCAQLAGDAASVQGAGGIRIGTVINSLSTFLISCTCALYYEWKLALILLSFAPLILISIFFERQVLAGDAEKNQKILEKSAKIAVEAISNIRTVTSLGCEQLFCSLYNKELLPYTERSRSKCHFRALVLGLARSLMLFAYAAGMSYGIKSVVNKEASYGTVFKVCEVVITGSWSIGNALSFSPNFHQGLAAAGRIFTLLKRVPLIVNVSNASTELWNKINLEYMQVFFSYPTRPTVSVLNGLNLSIREGQTVALVGSSGCGKSTIIQLLERFYDSAYGEISVDGTDLKQTDLKILRAQLGIVSQEPNLFDKTIAENIAYGANHKIVSLDELIQSAKSANIHSFIASLPLGYETRLGSKGTQLSGGQKQRIAIARALVRNPRILLLDEATSALDNESERVVQEALDNAKQGRTCITIAHRLTTIQDADVICVINEGQVVEIGNHSDLINKKGLYYKFYKLQSGQV